MTAFYKLNNNKSLLKSLYYSFNFNGYINSITNIQNYYKITLLIIVLILMKNPR